MIKEKLLIADCLGKHDGKGMPFGHYITFFEQYYKILKDNFEISLGVTKEYQKHLNFCNKFFTIRFGLNYGDTYKKYNIFDKYISISKVIINIITVLNSNYNIILFQQIKNMFSLIPFALYLGKKRIFIIVYKDYFNSGGKIKRLLKRLLYVLAKRKIKGLIVGMEELGKIYNHNYLVMPDYIFTSKYIDESTASIKYDIAVLGIITNAKQIIDVVMSFYKTKYQVIIAGKFKDNEQYKKVCQFNSDNITIVNDYISRKRYFNIIQSTKYVALPYDPIEYKLNSSGVFYDAIYHLRPLITSDTVFFKRVKENKIGYVYKNSIRESKEILEDTKIYREYVNNTKEYVKSINKDNKNKLIKFLSS